MDLNKGYNWNQPIGFEIRNLESDVSINAGCVARDGLGIVGDARYATATVRRGVRPSVLLVRSPSFSDP